MADEKPHVADEKPADEKPADEKPPPPWHRDPTKVVPLVVLLLGLPLTLNQIYQTILKEDPPRINVEYVVDVSDGMAGRIGGKEKLAAVKEEILLTVGGTPNIAYALRLAGPECVTSYQPPRVRFGLDNADDFERALGSVTAGGRSNFAYSVRHAVNDMIGQQGQEGIESTSLIFLIGGRDQCTRRPDRVIANELRRLDAQKTKDVHFKFVGVRMPKGTQQVLARTARRVRAAGLTATFEHARTAEDLESVINEPVGPSP